MLSVCIRFLQSSSTIQDFQRFQLQGYHFCDSQTALYIKKVPRCSAQIYSTQLSQDSSCSSHVQQQYNYKVGGLYWQRCGCLGRQMLVWEQNCVFTLISSAPKLCLFDRFSSELCIPHLLKNKMSNSCCFTFLQSSSKKITISILSRFGEIFNAQDKH